MSHPHNPFVDSAVPIPKWYVLYQSAMLELDSEKIADRIAEARHAICDRAEEILTSSPSDERRALNDALRVLRVLEEVTAKEKATA
jgi:hypothetical protein